MVAVARRPAAAAPAATRPRPGSTAAVRRRRTIFGISQTTLAEAVEPDSAHISRIESGSIQLPAAPRRHKIAAALGVTDEELIQSSDETTRSSEVRELHGQSREVLQHLSDDEALIVLGLIKGLFRLRG